MIVFGLFFMVVGVNAIRTQTFTDSIKEGTPSVVLGGLFVAAALVLFTGAGWLIYNMSEHGMRGY